MTKNKGVHYAWIILIALCMIRSLSAAAINNTGGLFLKPVADELQTGVGQLSIYFSIGSLATLLFMPFGGKLFHKYSIKSFLLVAVIMLVGGFIVLGFMNHVVAWYIISIPMGIGSAILVNLIGPLLINRWFKKDVGKALGILMASAGLVGVFIQPLTSSLIATRGWRFTYIFIGIVVFIILTISILLFLYKQPEDKGLQPYGQSLQESNDAQEEVKTGVPYSKARKSSTFYALIVFMVTITAFGAFQQHIATYGASLNFSASTVGTALSIGMLGSTIGAVIIGAISDRIGVFKTTFMILITILASILCLCMAHLHFLLFSLGLFLMGLGAIGIPVLSPLLTKVCFGEKDFDVIYSNVMMGSPLATILLLPLYGFIYDATGSYDYVFYLLALLISIGAFGILWSKNHYEKLSKHEV